MTHSILLTALLTFSSVTYAGKQAELRSYDPENSQASEVSATSGDALLSQADLCWNQKSDYTERRLWADADGNLSMSLTHFQVPKAGRSTCRVSVTIQVKAENEKCEGVQTLAFAMSGTKTFAVGKIKNSEGQVLSSLFSHYEGDARGAAMIVGSGRWQSKTKKGISIEGSITAIPVPTLGGDIGLGYTSCQLSFDLAPKLNEAEIEVSIHDGTKTSLNGKRVISLDQILNLSL